MNKVLIYQIALFDVFCENSAMKFFARFQRVQQNPSEFYETIQNNDGGGKKSVLSFKGITGNFIFMQIFISEKRDEPPPTSKVIIIIAN